MYLAQLASDWWPGVTDDWSAAGQTWPYLSSVHRSPKHMGAAELRQLLGVTVYDSALSFAVVRNPYDRLLSFYNFIRVSGRLRYAVGAKAHARAAAQALSFEGFVRRALRHREDWSYLFAQWQYVANPGKELLVKHVLHFENFEHELTELAREYDWPSPDFKSLGRRNASRRAEYRDMYPSRLRRQLDELVEDDCRLFGYSF